MPEAKKSSVARTGKAIQTPKEAKGARKANVLSPIFEQPDRLCALIDSGDAKLVAALEEACILSPTVLGATFKELAPALREQVLGKLLKAAAARLTEDQMGASLILLLKGLRYVARQNR